MKSDRFNFAIIGGGLTATAMLTQLIAMLKDRSAKRMLDPSRMTIQVFNRGDIFGPGYPHSDKIVLPFHITNMCASEMGIIAGNPRDFQDWVSDNFNYLRKRFAWFREGCSVTEDDKQGCHHYPRAIMGAYLKDRFQHAVRSGRRLGLEIHLFPRSKVVDLRQGNDTIRLRIEDLDSKAYFSKDAYGHRIHWEAIVNPTDKPADLLQRYLDDAINGDGPDGELVWQTVLHQTIGLLREVYLNLAFEERKRFDRLYSSVFFTHAAVQPAVNAEKLLALMKIGLVEVIKLGQEYRLIKKEDPTVYELTYIDIQGIERKDIYRYVVNARGQNKSLETDPSALAKTLYRSGTVQTTEIRRAHGTPPVNPMAAPGLKVGAQAYKTGSIWIDPATHKIMKMGSDDTITPSDAVYAVGAMTRGQIIDASMARSIVQSTSRVASDIIAYFTGNN